MHHANYSLLASLDPAHEEPEVEAQVDPTEETNPEPEQGKPRCITPPSLTFTLNCYLHVKNDCASGWLELIRTVVALWIPSELPLMTLLVFG
jgi:hypothetical protein